MKAAEFVKMKPHLEAYCDAREKLLEERKKDIPHAARYLDGRLDEVRGLRNRLNIIMVTKKEDKDVDLI